MKKTLVALAALAAMSAFAQSSVTIYGNIDYSFTPNKTKTTSDSAAATPVRTTDTNSGLTAAGANTNFSSNLIGFKGTEDLGNGLKANFQIETTLGGTQGDGSAATSVVSGASRDTWAGLSGNFGEVRAGYQTTDEHNVYALGEAGSTNLRNHLNGNALMGRQLRHDMVNYISPAFGGGFTAIAQWGKGTAKRDVDGETTTNAERQISALGLKYAAGPLTAAVGTRSGKAKTTYSVTQTAVTAANGTTSFTTAAQTFASTGVAFGIGGAAGSTTAGDVINYSIKTKANYAAGNYDMGSVKLFAGYITHKLDGSGDIEGVAQDALQRKTKSYTLGAQFPMGAYKPFVSFSKGNVKDSNTTDGVGIQQIKLTGLSVGTTYDLSKRTSLYAAYTTLKAVDTNEAANFSTVDKTKQTLVGLRHQF